MSFNSNNAVLFALIFMALIFHLCPFSVIYDLAYALSINDTGGL